MLPDLGISLLYQWNAGNVIRIYRISQWRTQQQRFCDQSNLYL